MSDYALTFCVSGESKVGKTELAATSPGKVLYINTEAGGMDFVEAPTIKWTPYEELPDQEDDWKLCKVECRDEATLSGCLQWLRKKNIPWDSVVLDSMTEMQTYLKREKSALYQLDQQDWGKLLAVIEGKVMELRDAVKTHQKLKSLVIIAHAALKDEKMRPVMQGAMATKMPFKLDINGYLFTTVDDEGEERRGLRIRATNKIDAGARWPRDLDKPDVFWDPSIEDIQATYEAHMRSKESDQ